MKNKKFCTYKNDEKEFKLKQEIKDHCHYAGKFRGAAHSICNLRYKIPREIPVVFHNASTYDYHFIIKQLAEEFKGEFKCLGENTEKYNTFSAPIKKGTDKLIADIIDTTNVENIEGYLLAIDFEKAFDSLNHNLLIAVLEKFGFGLDFINWIKILINDQESCVINSGHTTKYFKLERGARQGDPISA